MSIRLEYLGHSGFWITDGTHRVVIDPFLTGNPLATKTPADIACDWILLTHGHFDHTTDAEAIAKANGATIHATFELVSLFEKKGCQVSYGNQGGSITTPFGTVTLVPALHSSSFEGQYAGMPCGVIVTLGGVTVYHLGDTALFGDLALYGEIYQPDIALIPIGDRFTMGPRLASRAAEMIQPKLAIPIHYKTFEGMLVADAADFQPEGVPVRVLEPGEVLEYTGV